METKNEKGLVNATAIKVNGDENLYVILDRWKTERVKVNEDDSTLVELITQVKFCPSNSFGKEDWCKEIYVADSQVIEKMFYASRSEVKNVVKNLVIAIQDEDEELIERNLVFWKSIFGDFKKLEFKSKNDTYLVTLFSEFSPVILKRMVGSSNVYREFDGKIGDAFDEQVIDSIANYLGEDPVC